MVSKQVAEQSGERLRNGCLVGTAETHQRPSLQVLRLPVGVRVGALPVVASWMAPKSNSLAAKSKTPAFDLG
jgi:hypothetical protein